MFFRVNEIDSIYITDDDVDKFLNIDWKNGFDSFDEFYKDASDIYCVTFEQDTSKWKNATCTCVANSKCFMCKHILAQCFRLKIIKMKTDEDEYLSPNTKKGRHKKAVKGLAIQ